MKKLLMAAAAVMLLSVISCKKEKKTETDPTIPPSSIFEMAVPDGFNYESTRNFRFSSTIKTSSDVPVKSFVIALTTDRVENGGQLIYKGKCDASGVLSVDLKLPAATRQIICNANIPGVPEDIIVDVSSPAVTLNLGGSNPQWVKTISLNENYPSWSLGKNAARFSYRYLPGGWNAQGVPANLIVPRDVVSTQLVNDIWAALPSRQSVAVYHPTWLDDNQNKRTLLVNQTADVWVTFVTEGAGYRNALFYYKYHKDHPPATKNDIDSFYIIFPNASLINSNGGLNTGDKIYIGRIGADTVIAYGIAPDGFNATTGTVGVGDGLLYANKNFNPEVDPNLKQHLVMLYDAASARYIMGFEDITRNSSGCDHDFNDVLFYTTCTPANAISPDSIVSLPASNDTDGDGVNDADDEFPADNQRAFSNYYPAKNVFGTVAYEDLWPFYGDYDMNDVVVDFNYKVITNASNQVKDVNGTYVLKASGGQIINSFAVEFPVNASNVASITGASLESGQTKAVVKVIENIRNAQPRWNTITSEPFADTVMYNVAFTLTTPVALSAFGLNEYNPFIWGNSDGKNRGMEIHLPGKTPTALANTSVLGTGDDRTNSGTGKYYLSSTNLPWAIHTPVRFQYPIEKNDIVTVYLRFGVWAQTGGASYSDWYKDLTGYRNSSKIYVKP